MQLKELISTIKGKKPNNLFKNLKRNAIPYIDIQAFEKGIFEKFTDDKNVKFCGEGDILIVWDGSRSGLVGRAYAGAIGSTLAKVIVPEILSQSYLFYFLKSKFHLLNNRTKGSGTPHVDPAILFALELRVPPLPEQHAIVERIEELFSELDNGVENLRKAQQQLKTYRQSVLKWAFEGKLTEEWRRNQQTSSTETGEQLLEQIKQERQKRYHLQLQEWKQQVKAWVANGKQGRAPAKPKSLKELPPLTKAELAELAQLPDGWCWVRLGSIGDLIGGVTKGRKLENQETIQLPYLRVANVQDGYVDLRVMKTIEVLPSDLEKYKLEEGDILYTEGGDKDKLGRGTLWKNQIANCIHQNHVFRARVTKHLTIPAFVAYFSQTQTAKRYFFSKAKQTVNLASINLTVLSQLPLPLPQVHEQHQIVQEIERRLSVADQLEQSINHSLQQSESLRQSILKMAFNGKLTEKWREENEVTNT